MFNIRRRFVRPLSLAYRLFFPLRLSPWSLVWPLSVLKQKIKHNLIIIITTHGEKKPQLLRLSRRGKMRVPACMYVYVCIYVIYICNISIQGILTIFQPRFSFKPLFALVSQYAHDGFDFLAKHSSTLHYSTHHHHQPFDI